jgi:hypothetical protein
MPALHWQVIGHTSVRSRGSGNCRQVQTPPYDGALGGARTPRPVVFTDKRNNCLICVKVLDIHIQRLSPVALTLS